MGWFLILVLFASLAAAVSAGVQAGTQYITYTVQRGDTLWAIGQRYGVSPQTLAAVNGIANANRIYPGQLLRIPRGTGGGGGGIHTVVRGDTLWDLSRRYGVSLEALQQANPGVDPRRLVPGSTLIIPGAERQLANRAASATFIWPVRGRISSSFGPRQGGFHYGLDIACPQGSSIKAARSGRVVACGWQGGYGRVVVIDHGNGIETLYAHASELLVRAGQWVNQGEVIARVGSTGRSTGPHLHFEIRIDGIRVNPSRHLR
ncbi:MAG: M23 family metallopeptidase [bacterium]|jgi:murein DD-endopeptidase MepM/ murein hydrolase activator NlpD|nr:M23 family metallopeptidase [Bacillota bacterium]